MYWNHIASPALLRLIMGSCLSWLAASDSFAQPCNGNAGALGTSRVVALDPRVFPQVGTVQYPQTVPLSDHEVVLTFDDGPAPPSTDEVLNALAAHCVKATFFVVGTQAHASPDLVRREYLEGHTIGTHSETHADLARLPLSDAQREIVGGIDATNAALGSSGAAAPFFRAPNLSTTPSIEYYLSNAGIMLWSIDVDPEDWRPLTPDEVVARVMVKLKSKGSGIILMHDVQAHTAAALPTLLNELEINGYRVVHVVFGSAKEAAAHAP